MSALDEFKKAHHNYMIDISDYYEANEIGRGSSSIVFSARNLNTDRKEAAKVFIVDDCESKYDKIFNREIKIMMELKNPTINKFIGFSTKDFYYQNNLTIFMTFFEKGSLRKLLENTRKNKIYNNFDNTKKQIILIGIARGMWFLH